MTVKFLQSFDKKIQEPVDTQKEYIQLLEEQKLYYEAEIKIAQENAYKKAQKEFNNELKEKLEEEKQKNLKKFIEDIQGITTEYETYHRTSIENFSKIVFIFFKNYVPLVTKKILKEEISEQLELIFKNIHQKKIRFIAHPETINQIQMDFSIESIRIEWFEDNTLPIGDLNLEFEGGGVSFSSKNIEYQLNEIFKNCFDFDMSFQE